MGLMFGKKIILGALSNCIPLSIYTSFWSSDDSAMFNCFVAHQKEGKLNRLFRIVDRSITVWAYLIKVFKTWSYSSIFGSMVLRFDSSCLGSLAEGFEPVTCSTKRALSPSNGRRSGPLRTCDAQTRSSFSDERHLIRWSRIWLNSWRLVLTYWIVS